MNDSKVFSNEQHSRYELFILSYNYNTLLSTFLKLIFTFNPFCIFEAWKWLWQPSWIKLLKKSMSCRDVRYLSPKSFIKIHPVQYIKFIISPVFHKMLTNRARTDKNDEATHPLPHSSHFYFKAQSCARLLCEDDKWITRRDDWCSKRRMLWLSDQQNSAAADGWRIEGCEREKWMVKLGVKITQGCLVARLIHYPVVVYLLNFFTWHYGF